jgi:hypothetical protein
VQDLLLRANYLFVPALMASAPTGEPRFDESRSFQRKSNAATLNPHGGSSDEQATVDLYDHWDFDSIQHEDKP